VTRSYAADLWLLGGGLPFGVLGGAAGVWRATRPRTLGARVLEAGAMLAFCTPVYVVGLGLLLLLSPPSASGTRRSSSIRTAMRRH
jgi:ABC-type Fe3+ transport system permease subunit